MLNYQKIEAFETIIIKLFPLLLVRIVRSKLKVNFFIDLTKINDEILKTLIFFINNEEFNENEIEENKEKNIFDDFLFLFQIKNK